MIKFQPVKNLKPGSRMPKAKNRTVSQPADWWDAYEHQARKLRMPLAQWIGDCCNENLPAEVKAKLSERIKPGRPKQ